MASSIRAKYAAGDWYTMVPAEAARVDPGVLLDRIEAAWAGVELTRKQRGLLRRGDATAYARRAKDRIYDAPEGSRRHARIVLSYLADAIRDYRAARYHQRHGLPLEEAVAKATEGVLLVVARAKGTEAVDAAVDAMFAAE